jgi:hypothetical protein
MKSTVSYGRGEETPEAKARWFQSLTLEERMDVLCYFTDLALSVNPNLPDLKDAQQTKRGIQILSRA